MNTCDLFELLVAQQYGVARAAVAVNDEQPDSPLTVGATYLLLTKDTRPSQLLVTTAAGYDGFYRLTDN